MQRKRALQSSMTVPSFARATRSSTLKTSPRGDKSRDAALSDTQRSSAPSLGSPKSDAKLKRPSTLTQRARESIAYNADLTHIMPSNPSKPCPLAELPSELRTLVYSFVFGDLRRPVLMYYGRIKYSPSVLLQICRAIRIEAAYDYFAGASFTWTITNLNFTMVMRWLNCLQPAHRALLSRNPNMTIDIFPGLAKSFTYPPVGYLLDDTMENHWKTCQPFINLYAVSPGYTRDATIGQRFDRDLAKMRIFYILFCRLAAWSKMRTHSSFANMSWRYTFDFPSSPGEKRSLYATMARFVSRIERHLPVLKTYWVRDQCEDRIRRPFLELLDALLCELDKLIGPEGVTSGEQSLIGRLKDCRDRIERWDRSKQYWECKRS